jgi:hypothetical protein
MAATIEALAALDRAGPEMLRERDEIVEALKIVRLPAPVLARMGAAAGAAAEAAAEAARG